MLKKITYSALILLLAGLLFMNFRLYKNSRNIVFVDTAYLFNNFKMKEEFESQFNEIKKVKQQKLDSLYDAIILLKKGNGAEDLKSVERQYLYERKMAIEDQERLQSSYNSQIWTRLNQYIKEYGNEKGIDLILGANGEGTIMHGKEDMNISEAVVTYANTKYNGK
jgi:outer membrane protein